MQRRYKVGQDRVSGEIVGAVGADDDDAHRFAGHHHMTEKLQGLLIGPMQVVEHEDDRRVG